MKYLIIILLFFIPFISKAQSPALEDQTKSFKNVEAMVGRVGKPGAEYKLKGYFEPQDGGGGRFFWDDTCTVADDGGLVLRVSGVATGAWRRIVDAPYLMPEQFGAIGYKSISSTVDTNNIVTGYFTNSSFTTPLVNRTAEFQKCLEASYSAGYNYVFCNKAYYLVDSIMIPVGMHFEGTVPGDNGRRPGNDGTVILQDVNVNNDCIFFSHTYLAGVLERISAVNLENFVVRGNNSNTVGNGISMRKSGNRLVDANHCVLIVNNRFYNFV